MNEQSQGRDYRAMRQLTGLSQRKLEDVLGWQHGWLSLIERGLRDGPKEQALIAKLRELVAAGINRP